MKADIHALSETRTHERAKTFHTSDRAATVVGHNNNIITEREFT
jgi:hypothetical protein